jgi:multimeric flavodoxin WrbA
MAKVLIVYYSLTGRTQRMAEYLAEGLRFAEREAVIKKTSEIETAEDLNGYDGYLFGSPTYHQDMAGPVKTFLFQARTADLEGKLAGSFGSYTHSGDAPAMVFDTMRYVYRMRPFYLGPFNLLEAKVGTQDGMRACHDYGRAFGEKLMEPWTAPESDEGSDATPDSPTPWALT